MAARKSTYAALNRARTIIYFIFHTKKCCFCGKKFKRKDIRDFRLTMDHENENRKDNSLENQRWAHPPCHKSYTLKKRMPDMIKYAALCRAGKKKPGKTKIVRAATPWGG